MIDKNFVYAVIGASNDHAKYGYKVFKNLLDAGFKVIPINPHETQVDGEKVYSSLTEAIENYFLKIDVVVTVVPPKVTAKIVDEVLDLEIERIWMQPGSEDADSIQIAEELGVEVVSGACIMVKN
jgi:predicted CoA-binding protein